MCTMKAMQLTKIGPVEERCLGIVDIPVPEVGGHEILIKVSVCGACHTDLDEAEGRLIPPRLPVVPGHQVVGTVAAKGSETNRFEIGDRVGATWLYWACGECAFCEAGIGNNCQVILSSIRTISPWNPLNLTAKFCIPGLAVFDKLPALCQIIQPQYKRNVYQSRSLIPWWKFTPKRIGPFIPCSSGHCLA